jgi:transmembrane E3 ubiquitin-protein ligase
LRPSYVLGISATRLALPLYLLACPRNLLRVPPAPGVAFGLTAFVGLQARGRV